MDAYDIILSKCLDDFRAMSAVSESSVTTRDVDTVEMALKAKTIEDLQSALTVAFSPTVAEQLAWHRFILHETKTTDPSMSSSSETNAKRVSLGNFVKQKAQVDRVASLWCFSAGAVLSDFVQREGVHALVVTSGTLGPLPRTEESLGAYGRLPFEVKLENDHVIASENLCVEVLTAGRKDTPFCFTMRVGRAYVVHSCAEPGRWPNVHGIGTRHCRYRGRCPRRDDRLFVVLSPTPRRQTMVGRLRLLWNSREGGHDRDLTRF